MGMIRIKRQFMPMKIFAKRKGLRSLRRAQEIDGDVVNVE